MNTVEYTLVTGATSDIGKQICRTLEESGQSLLMTDLDLEELNSFRSELSDSEKHLVLAMDLSDVNNSKEVLVSFLSESHLAITNVVFAAGLFSIKPIKLVNYDFLKKSFNIAVFSVYLLTQVLVSKKINPDNLKSIVVVSSVSAKIGTKGYSVYSAVKASLIGFVKSMSVELAPKVRVNAVLPGGIKTRTTQFIYDSNEGVSNPRYLLGDGNCSDVANVVDFLVSDKAKWVTGQEFIVDGGLTSN